MIDLRHSRHAAIRAQQRAVPPLIEDWLTRYGAKQHDGHGGVIRYFSKKSVRKLEQAFGAAVVRALSRYLDRYRVESAVDGTTITVGHRIARVRRR